MERSPFVLKNHGRLVSIVDIPAAQNLLEAWSRNIDMMFFFIEPTRQKMEALRTLIEQERIRPIIDSVMPLSLVGEVQQRQEAGGVQGKIVFDTSK